MVINLTEGIKNETDIFLTQGPCGGTLCAYNE